MRVPAILSDPALNQTAIDHLRAYYGPGSPYTGRHFDSFAGGGARAEVADRITAEDLLTLPMLSMRLTGEAVIHVLQEQAEPITALLRQLPVEVPLWEDDAEALVRRDGPAWQLWSLLRGVPGFGVVTTSKLMARKRPLLVPIQDDVLRLALGVKTWRDSWGLWREGLLTPGIRVRLESWRSEAQVDPDLSLLRVLDVVLWMQYRPAWKSGTTDTTADDVQT